MTATKNFHSMNKQKIKRSTSFDQNKLRVVGDSLCDRIEDLLQYMNLEYKINSKFISMSCPIHGGDNEGALNLYYTGDNYRGNWVCRTHGCEQHFKPSILGFIRGVISSSKYNWQKNGDTACSFNEVVDFATEFLNISLQDIKISKLSRDKTNFISTSKILAPIPSDNPVGIKRRTVQSGLDIPSQYFVDRGFSKEILIKYDVGECRSKGKEMESRAVVPIYDMNHLFMIGCSGRSIYTKCEKCSSYHDGDCPSKEEAYKFCKWRHSSGLKTQQCLYNFWYAKEHILSSSQIIIVESPGNVWKLEENYIHNSVAILGSNLSDQQKTILDMSGAMEIVIITDNDDAGEKARKQINDKCNRTYNIKNIRVSKNDIADMTNEEIEKEIKVLL